MNVYEESHNLARAIRESDEFKEYDRLKKQVEMNPSSDQLVKDIQHKQLEIQTKQLTGQLTQQEAMALLQPLYTGMMQDPLAMQFMQAQIRFSLMMKDVYEIVGEPAGMGDLSALMGNH